MNQSKTCNRCKQIKPILEFGKHIRSKDGFYSMCKSCKGVSDKNYAEKNKAKIAAYHKEWLEKNRDYVNQKNRDWCAANPERSRAHKRKYAALHVEEKSETNRLWRLNNVERQREATKAWALKHPERRRKQANKRRAAKYANGQEDYTEQQIFDLYGTNCHLCNEPIDFDAPRKVGKPGWERGLHIEHLVSVFKGGPDMLANVRPSHGLCNLQKGWR